MNEAEILSLLPAIVQESVTLAISIAVIYLLFKYFSRRIDRKYTPHSNAKLTNHYVFTKMDYWRKVVVPNLRIDEYKRDLIFKRFLHIKFEVSHRHLMKFAQGVEDLEMSAEELKRFSVETLTEMIEEYQKIVLEHNIPKVVIDKFNNWHKAQIFMIEDSCSLITKSSFYCDNKTKCSAILDIYVSSYEMTLIDAERALTQINGQIDKHYEDLVRETGRNLDELLPKPL